MRKYCPNCGQSVSDERFSFCTQCGALLATLSNESASTSSAASDGGFRPFLSIAICFGKVLDYSGRARPGDFWSFTVLRVVLTFATFISIVPTAASLPMEQRYYTLIAFAVAYGLLLLPWLAVGVRRFHDSGQSGALFFLEWIVTAITTPLSFVGLVFAVYSTDTTQGEPIPWLGWLAILACWGAFLGCGIHWLKTLVSPGDPDENRYGPKP